MDNKDPRFNTTLHNHKDISDNGKPLISNAEYKALSENLSYETYNAHKEKYSFEPKAEEILLARLQKRII